MEFVVTQHPAVTSTATAATSTALTSNSQCPPEVIADKVKIIARNSTITKATHSLLTHLMSIGALQSLVDSPYDELSKYQIDDNIYQIEDEIYMISEMINDDHQSIYL